MRFVYALVSAESYDEPRCLAADRGEKSRQANDNMAGALRRQQGRGSEKRFHGECIRGTYLSTLCVFRLEEEKVGREVLDFGFSFG